MVLRLGLGGFSVMTDRIIVEYNDNENGRSEYILASICA